MDRAVDKLPGTHQILMLSFANEYCIIQDPRMLLVVCWNWVGVFLWLFPSEGCTCTLSGGSGMDRAVDNLPGTHQILMLSFATAYYIIQNPRMLLVVCCNWVGVFLWPFPSEGCTFTLTGGRGIERAVYNFPGNHSFSCCLLHLHTIFFRSPGCCWWCAGIELVCFYGLSLQKGAPAHWLEGVV